MEPLEGPALDLGATPGLQVRMWLHLIVMAHTLPNGMNVFFLKRSRVATEADQVDDTGDLQELKTVAKCDTHKDVARKQRHLKCDAAVFPAADGRTQRQEMFYLPYAELLRRSSRGSRWCKPRTTVAQGSQPASPAALATNRR